MTYADELRALADWIETETQLVRRDIERHEAYVAGVVVLRALADKLQGKVVVRPHIVRGGGNVFANLPTACTIGQCSEAEAIANLQTQLDAARGEG